MKKLALFLLFATASFAQGPTAHGVLLSWSWSQGTGAAATGFRVYVSTTPGGPYTRIFDGNDPALRALDDAETSANPFIEGSTRYYVVGTKGAGGAESIPSPEVAAVIPKRPQAPTSPQAVPR